MEKPSPNNSSEKNMLIKLCSKCHAGMSGNCTRKEFRETCENCGAKRMIKRLY